MMACTKKNSPWTNRFAASFAGYHGRQSISDGSPDRLPVLGIQDPVPLVFFFIEVQLPVTVVPLQRNFTPSHRHLGIRIERSDIGPCTGTVLSWVADSRRIRILGVSRPCVTRQMWIAEAGWCHSHWRRPHSTTWHSGVTGHHRRMSATWIHVCIRSVRCWRYGSIHLKLIIDTLNSGNLRYSVRSGLSLLNCTYVSSQSRHTVGESNFDVVSDETDL